MIGRSPLFSCVTVLFALTLLGGTALQAQQTVSSRFRVLIPDFQPLNEEDDDFGILKRLGVSKELPRPRVVTLLGLPMQSSSFPHSAMHEEGMG